MTTKTICLKVTNLRKKYGDCMNLELWMSDENNVYVGRYGRIFIGRGEGKRIFHYCGSKFANPFKVGEKEGEFSSEARKDSKKYSLEDAIEKYKIHLVDDDLLSSVEELRGKTLGCFCDQSGLCHAKVLAEYLNTGQL